MIALLSEHLRLVAEPHRRSQRAGADTFDRRLAGAGLVAAFARTGGRQELVVADDEGTLELHAPVGRRDRVLASELPEGELRERIAPVLGNRAVLPLARVRSRLYPLRVVNADDKTVVRLIVEEADAVRPGTPAVTLTPRVRITGVRGYDSDRDRVVRLLADELGAPPAAESRLDEAVVALGGRVGPAPRPELRADDRADRALATVLLRLADVIAEQHPGTIDDLDPEFLHDLRVAVRRTRSLLREIKGVLPPAERDHFRAELKWVQSVTSPMRDLDVHLEDLDAHRDELPAAMAADLVPLRDLLRARRVRALRAMRRNLRSARMEGLMTAWPAFLSGVATAAAPEDPEAQPKAGRPIAGVAARRISRVYADIVERGSTVGDDTPDEYLHDLRKRGKELRYLLEMFGGLFGAPEIGDMVKALKSLQDVLGRFQDRHIQADTLRALGPDLAAVEGGPGALMAVGLIVDRLAAEQAAARGEFAGRFAQFAAPARQKAIAKALK